MAQTGTINKQTKINPMIEKELIQSGAFLALSRKQPELFSSAKEFVLDNGTQVEVSAPGIISFTPANAGDKDIILSSGVHGNETAPIEICDEFVQQILKGELKLAHRVLFLFGNLPAMDIAERFVEENMNRLFSGAHSHGEGLVNAERHRAKLLEESVEHFFLAKGEGRKRYHYDLHTAIRASKNEKFAVYPFLHGKPRKKEQLQFMLACGVNTIMLSESPTTTFSYFSSHQFGADAFTVELGKVRPFGENDMSRFADAKNSLHRLMTEDDPQFGEYNEDAFYLYRVNQIINREQQDFRLNFADDVPNFTDYPKGYLLAEESGARYEAQFDGEAIVFPNANVALGQRALLTVVPTSLDEA